MSITPKNKSSKTVSERERFIGFVYVLTLFIVITGACGFILFKYAGTRHIFSNKIMVIKKMERQKEFQNIQSVQIVSADTLFSRIEQFEPGVNASYEENDIKFLINDLAKQWEKNSFDKRNKMFWHLASVYEMWFADKKELGSKQDNMAIGALQAIQAAGRTVNKDIYLVGVDALDAAKNEVANGNMTGTVLNDAKGQATQAVASMEELLGGKTFEANHQSVYVDYVKVTPDNVKDFQ